MVTFNSPYASWQDLFGPSLGVLPQHLLANRDRHAEMKDGYRWSGGPWLIQSWTKGQSVVLVPNRRYWGEQPKLDRVVFRFVTDNSAEEQAYRTGQVQVITPIGRSSRADLRSFPNTNFSITPSNNFEVMMFNTQRPPLNDKAVRQALAYATDRSSITKTVFNLAAGSEPLDSFLSPANPDYVTPFRRYQRDLQKVDEIMRADGWSRGQDGIWARQGQRATIEFTTSDPFPPGRAEIEGNMLKAQWQEAGFDVTAKPSPSEAFFGDILPNAKFSTATYYWLWGQTFSPADCFDWCSENIAPTGFASDYSLFRSQTLDDLFHQIAGELDETRRKALVAQAQDVLADEVPGLPFATTPTVIYWRTSVRGPIGPNEPLGPLTNLNQWYCAGGHCPIP